MINKLGLQIPASCLRIGILGSGSFWCPESPEICLKIGQYLASIPTVAIFTGGMPGVGKTVGRAFFDERIAGELPPNVFHILPHGFGNLDYGKTVHAGNNMKERREILAGIASVYIVVEGGPGTEYEVRTALKFGAHIIPAACTGGFAENVYAEISKPDWVDTNCWKNLREKDCRIEDIIAVIQQFCCYFSHHLHAQS